MIVLFTGPSLAASDVPAVPGVTVLPPVAQGDVYRAARERPWGIGIIDGFFEHVPAVWHKEILWAMSQGVHVFGAASMGALRATELVDFGMVGVGWIFEQFRTGVLDADDEVAIAHLSAEHGYRAVSEALVNIRATLAAAVTAGVIDRALADQLVALAKARFYPERTWPALFADARARHGSPAALETLERWLEAGRIDQKHRDALQLVEVMRLARAEHPEPKRVTFAFEYTDLWEHALPRMREERADVDAGTDPSWLLDELRVQGDDQQVALATQGALLRALAEDLGARHGFNPGPELIEHAIDQFRRRRGLYTAAATHAWVCEQGLDGGSFMEMMAREATLQRIETGAAPEVRRHVVDQLRAMSCYGRLAARARAKQAALAHAGELPVVDDRVLWSWYFEDRLRTRIPEDIAAHAERLGFTDEEAFRRAVRIERWFASRQ